MPSGDRLRLYVDATAPVTPAMGVYAQTAPGRFDSKGQPMGVRAAPDQLARAVRLYLRDHRIADDLREATFEPAV